MRCSGNESRISPEQLAQQAKAGDNGAFVELFLRILPVIRKKVFRYCPQNMEREDLMQEGAIGFLSAVKRYDPRLKIPFVAFASVCIENKIISALRSSGRRKNLPLNLSVPLSSISEEMQMGLPSADPAEVFIGREQLKSVVQAMRTQLSPLEQQVLTHYLSGCSYGEVASRLGLTEKSVDNALQRIRLKLRKELLL